MRWKPRSAWEEALSGGASVEADGVPRDTVGLVLLLVTLLALILRLYRIGGQSLWVDELITILQGSRGGHSLFEQFLDDYQNPLPMVVVAWMHRVSPTEAWLRLPGALLASFTPLLLYAVGARIAGWRAGLFAALLLAVHPLHVYYAQEVRGYAYLLFFGLAAVAVALGADGRLSWRRALAFSLLAVAACLSNLQGILWMAGLGLGLLAARRMMRHDAARWAAAFAIVLVATAPWWSAGLRRHESSRLVPGRETGAPLRGATTWSPWAVPYAGFVLAVGNTLGPTPRELRARAAQQPERAPLLPRRHLPVAVGVAALTSVLALAGLGALGRRRSAEVLLWAGVPLAAALVLAARNVKPFNPRYVLAAMPSLLLLLAAGLDRLPHRWARSLLLVWLAVAAVGLARYYAVPAYGREDVRSAARLVEEREGSHDAVLVPTVTRVFEYYYRGRSPVFGHRRRLWPDATSLATRLQRLAPQRRFLWYVRARPWEDDPDGLLLGMLEQRYRRVGVHRLPGVDVYLYDRSALAPPDSLEPGAGEKVEDTPPQDAGAGGGTREPREHGDEQQKERQDQTEREGAPR